MRDHMSSGRFIFIGLLLQFAGISKIYSQQSVDSVLYSEPAATMRQVYFAGIGDDAQIYHGSEFIRNGQKSTGFPFYESDTLLTGYVSYQGTVYPARSLYYDLVFDQVITNNFAHNAFIILSIGKVDSFKIGSHVFIPLKSTKFNHLPKDGYYDRLVSGVPELFALREKKFLSGVGSEEPKYVQYNSYYVRMKNAFYEVDGKNSLLDLFGDRRDDLKKYIRANKLNFKKRLEPSLVQITAYYSQLKF
jgi:hypothetical protein